MAAETEHEGGAVGHLLGFVTSLYAGRPTAAPDGVSASGFDHLKVERERAMEAVGAETDDVLRVAYVGDRTYSVPRWCFLALDIGDGVAVSVLVEVGDDGRGRIRWCEVTGSTGIEPVAMQRIPWGKIAHAAVTLSARDEDRFRPQAFARDRAAADKAASRKGLVPGRAERSPVGDDRLRLVQEARARHQAAGADRWDVAAAQELSYSPAYLRQLASKADKRLGPLP